jgi:hypothetical protein
MFRITVSAGCPRGVLGNLCFLAVPVEEIGAKTLHMLSHTRFTFTLLLWKLNWLFHGSPLLVTRIWNNITSKAGFYIIFWAPSEHTIIFMKIPLVQFYLER